MLATTAKWMDIIIWDLECLFIKRVQKTEHLQTIKIIQKGTIRSPSYSSLLISMLYFVPAKLAAGDGAKCNNSKLLFQRLSANWQSRKSIRRTDPIPDKPLKYVFYIWMWDLVTHAWKKIYQRREKKERDISQTALLRLAEFSLSSDSFLA